LSRQQSRNTIARYQTARFVIVDVHRVLRDLLGEQLKRVGAERVRFVHRHDALWEALAEEPAATFVIADWNADEGPAGVDMIHRIRETDAIREASLILLADQVTPEMEALTEVYRVATILEKPYTAKQVLLEVDRELRLRESPTEFELLLKRGWQLLEEGTFEKALLVYNWLRQLNPDSLAALYGAGEAMSGKGELDDARAVFEDLIARSPMFLQGVDRLTDIAEAQGDHERAIELIERAIQLAPGAADRQVKLARQKHKSGDPEAAENALRRALRESPELWEATLSLSELLLAQDRLPEAREIVEGAQKHHPRRVELFNDLGIAFRRQGRLDEAARCYDTALAIDPNNAVLRYNAAVVQFMLGNNEVAAEWAQMVMRAAPQLNAARKLYEAIKSGKSPKDV
jgi:tetratricopeptide (TPR) repeat protein